jgi:hypothetical protein
MPRSVDSLDDLSSEGSYDEEEEYKLAQKEWEESMVQLQQLCAVVLLPFLGKWLGRKWSYWGNCFFCSVALFSRSEAYARYLRLGLTRQFFLGQRG